MFLKKKKKKTEVFDTYNCYKTWYGTTLPTFTNVICKIASVAYTTKVSTFH